MPGSDRAFLRAAVAALRQRSGCKRVGAHTYPAPHAEGVFMPRVPAGRLIRLIRMLTALSVGAALASCGGQSNTLYSAPNSVILADLNGDGALDISVASAVLATNG